jgi:hypothetical protein
MLKQSLWKSKPLKRTLKLENWREEGERDRGEQDKT